MIMLYQVQNSESKNGKIIRYETIATYHDFKEGDKLCNILYDNDCITVSGGNLNIEIGDYPKVYVKQ